jgi:hypothetical protein
MRKLRWLVFAVAATGLSLLPAASQVAEAGFRYP